MCTHPFAKKALTLHLTRSEGHERYFGCNLMHRKVLASSHQHLTAEAPELAQCGVEPVQTRENVDEALKRPGTTLVVVNSVCGCAAGSARPGVTRALQHSTIPDHLTTVFAGVDRETTERAREHMVGVAPSSPSVALFKDGELVHMLERRHIEMMNDEMVAQNLTEAFDKYCSRQGPSVLREEYEKVVHARQCGSSVLPWCITPDNSKGISRLRF